MSDEIQKVLAQIEQLEEKEKQQKKLMNDLKAVLQNLNAKAEADEPALEEHTEIEEAAPNNILEIEEIDLDEPVLIAVAGADTRVGTTHHAIEMASCLCRKGKNPAVLEFNKSGGFMAIARFAGKEQEGCFLFRNISFYPECTLQLLEKIAASKKHDYIILDLGRFSEEKTLFSRSDVKLMVSGARPWELESLLPVFHALDKEVLKNAYFIFNFVSQSEEMREKIIGGMGELKNIIFADYIADPFLKIDEMLEILLLEYVDVPEEEAEYEEKKKLTLFRRKKDEVFRKRRAGRKYNFIPAISAAE